MESKGREMQDLVPIGRFSELTELTVKALRLYDRLGLLRPAMVDFASGYRYYSREQVRVARYIRLLRWADMPLEEIARVLGAEDPAVLRSHLARHRQRIEERLETGQQALALLEELDKRVESAGIGGLMTQEDQDYRCSFCGKPRSEILRMIAGPNDVFICNECVDLCNEIIAKEEAKA